MIMLLAILIKCCSSSCPSSVSSTSKIESGLYSFSEFSTTKTFRLQFGMISGSMYILDYVSSPTVSMVVRRINSDDSISWSYAISSQPSLKSLAVDSKEVNVYVMPYLASSLVLKFDAKTGALVRADLIGLLNLQIYSVKVNLMSDNNGLYLISKSNSNQKVDICRLMYSPSITADCQEVSNMDGFCYAQAMLSDSSFFFQALDKNTYYLRVLKMTYGSTSPDWAYYVACTSSTCGLGRSEALTDSNIKTIYSLSVYGDTSKYLLFMMLNALDGSITGNRYTLILLYPCFYNL